MRCIYCNSNIPDGAAFCPSCGKQQENPSRPAAKGFCPVCGSQLAPGAAFCKACGTRNTTASAGGQGRPAGAQGQQVYQQGGNMRQGSGPQSGPVGMQGQPPRGMNQGQPPLGAYPQGGQKISPQYNNVPGRPVENDSSGSKMALIIVFCVLGALIIGMGTMYIYKTFISPSGKDQSVSQGTDSNNGSGNETITEAVTETVTVADSTEEKTEEARKETEDERPNADYDFNQDDDLEMTGTLEKNSDGYIIIDWGTKYSFADGKDYLEEEKSARLDLSEWDKPIFDYAELGDELND